MIKSASRNVCYRDVQNVWPPPCPTYPFRWVWLKPIIMDLSQDPTLRLPKPEAGVWTSTLSCLTQSLYHLFLHHEASQTPGQRRCPQIMAELVITCWQVWSASEISMGHWWCQTVGRISSTRTEISSSAIVSTTNPTWTALVLSPSLRGEKQVSNPLNSRTCLCRSCAYTLSWLSAVSTEPRTSLLGLRLHDGLLLLGALVCCNASRQFKGLELSQKCGPYS
jgi:hypothetical protein